MVHGKRPPEERKERDAARRLFGENLRDVLLRLDRSPEEVADAVGVTTDAIYKYMRGVREPDIYTIRLLARTLGVSIEGLILGPRRGRLRVVGIE